METRKEKDKKKIIKQYICGYCGYTFIQKVGSTETNPEGKRSKVSSQVRCNHCFNFLKTWKDGKEDFE